ncbi:MAG: 4-oxalomesaconate tautomerase [Burkholderiales bacterium]|nr:4-oxalomesaconate tautomerase [Burkholderiales bacterium]
MTRGVPCLLMRGGTSKGPFFLASDLPHDVAERDRWLLAAMGSPDARQIDGLGGADPLTSKVGILARSSDGAADLDFLFAQVAVREARVDTTPNCGNMLAAAGPAAVEFGLLAARGDATTLRIRTINTGMIAESTFATPGGEPAYEGDARIDGVPGTASPVTLNFLDTAGSVCGSLLPTGRVVDFIDGVPVTCIDNGMPVMVVPSAAFGLTGYESRESLNANTGLKARLNALRLAAGPLMNLGDVAGKVVPKITLVAPPVKGGALCTRTFIPHDCHAAIGVLGAVTVATAAVLEGSVAHAVAQLPPGDDKLISVEHPSGEFSVALSLARGAAGGQPEVRRAALLRTARLLMRGEVPPRR